MDEQAVGRRAVSPVIGTVLLLVISVILAGFVATVFFGLADETDPQPNVVLAHSDTNNATARLVHEGGETLAGDRLELRGALDPDVAAGQRIESGDELNFYPISKEITVVWHGDSESYRLTTITVEQVLPEPDVGCDWVETKTDGGTDPITIDGTVVNCDVQTDELITVKNDGVVVGETVSENKGLDVDDGEVYGDTTVQKVINVQDGQIRGSATSTGADVKIYNTGVEASISAGKVAEVQDGATVDGSVTAENAAKIQNSTVSGDVESNTEETKVQAGSAVEGSVTADETVTVEDSTIEGHVYIEPSNFTCTGAEINGEDCSSYTPRDPDDW